MHYSSDDNPLVHLNTECLLHDLTVILHQSFIFRQTRCKSVLHWQERARSTTVLLQCSNLQLATTNPLLLLLLLLLYKVPGSVKDISSSPRLARTVCSTISVYQFRPT